MCESFEDEFEIDDFKISEENIKKNHQNLFSKGRTDQEKEHNRFVRAILYAIKFDKTNEKNIVKNNNLKKVLTKNL